MWDLIKAEFNFSLSRLFPVRLPKFVAEYSEPPAAFGDAFAEPVTECGILWVGWDVRRTGIERHNAQ